MFGDFPFGLMFLNFVGMVLFFLVLVMAVKFLVRGARGYGGPGRSGPWHRHWAADGGRYGSGDWGGDGGGDEHGFAAGRGSGKGSGKGRGRRWSKHHGSSGHGRCDQTLEHANLRLARGEITTEQYQELRAALAQAPAHSGASGVHQSSAPGNRHGGNWEHGHSGGHHGRGRDRALGIARLRLASGEIGVEEFNSLRETLAS